eukprot:TRINITY_DN59983_c0_g1_i1.p1 TRINITY_DN59983_c0_g1~~TRINITY_DN59983_c0_g1_i1.p1  ORF type:complete len:264 (-),score=22.60 TRINITY_DN59983_c0_g1_i1:3-794(-)
MRRDSLYARRRGGWNRHALLILNLTCLCLLTICSVPTLALVASSAAAGSKDLLVVGAGNLGRRVAGLWLGDNEVTRVIGTTLTEESHAHLRALGIEPITVSDAVDMDEKFPNVLFCAPPRTKSNPDSSFYVQAVRDAMQHWAGQDHGCFVFTSSGGVISEDSGRVVSEESPVSDSPGVLPLLAAEEIVLAAGGTVLRLAGLYDDKRGGHAYWMKAGVVKGNSEGLINLVHYDDAAKAVQAALTHRSAQGKLFLVSDGVPMSRR